MPSKRMLRRMVRPESIRPDAATRRLCVRPPCSECASRRSDSSSSIRSCSPTRSTWATARSFDSTIRCSSASSASRWRLIASGSPASTPVSRRRSAAASSSVPSEPRSSSTSSNQPSSASCSATDRSASTFVPCCWEICPGAPALESRSVSICTRLPSLVDARVLLRQHDLVGHRGQVDLVGLLVEVVLLGEVLGVEVVADVDRLAVAVALLRGLAGLLRQREVLQRPGVGEVLVAVPVPVAHLRRPDLDQREEPVEDLVEDLLVAPVLDQRDAQGGLEVGLVGEHPRLAGAGHRVEGLGDRDPYLPQPQQPHEPVDRVLHQPSPWPLECSESGVRCVECTERRFRYIGAGVTGRAGRPAPKLRLPRSAVTFGFGDGGGSGWTESRVR